MPSPLGHSGHRMRAKHAWRPGLSRTLGGLRECRISEQMPGLASTRRMDAVNDCNLFASHRRLRNVSDSCTLSRAITCKSLMSKGRVRGMALCPQMSCAWPRQWLFRNYRHLEFCDGRRALTEDTTQCTTNGLPRQTGALQPSKCPRYLHALISGARRRLCLRGRHPRNEAKTSVTKHSGNRS